MPTLRIKVGLSIAVLLALVDVGSMFDPTPAGEDGPPLGILILGGILGLITLALVVPAWRGNRLAARVAIGARILSALSGLPAFFVDVPAVVMVAVAVSVVLTVISAVLVLTTVDRRQQVDGNWSSLV